MLKEGVFLNFEKNILSYLAPKIRGIVERIKQNYPEEWMKLEEIRLRAERPLQIEMGDSVLVSSEGKLTTNQTEAFIIAQEDLIRTLQLIGKNSLYTLEEELKEGYITLPGGHRIGLAGECLVERGSLVRIKRITSLNIRIARELKGISHELLPFLTEKGRPLRTIIISPPQAGKTTLLRDLIRCFSNGEHLPYPVKVGLVDERGEISGCYQGIPQLDVGVRTDLLSGCPKKEGVFLLLRTMGPQIIATDEIGRPGDLEILEEILNTGVGFITTAHAWNTKDFSARPLLRKLWFHGLVERVVTLSRRFGPGTLEGIWDGKTKEPMLTGARRLEVRR